MRSNGERHGYLARQSIGQNSTPSSDGAIGDLSAGYGGVMVSLGNKLGPLQGDGRAPVRSAPQELAGRTGCAERYVREWLNAQAAGGYVDYHARQRHLRAVARTGAVLADEDSPVLHPACLEGAGARCGSTRTRRSTRSAPARGVAWGDHDGRLYCGVAAFYRNGYRASLVAEWLPALDGVTQRLDAGVTRRRRRLRPRPLDAC